TAGVGLNGQDLNLQDLFRPVQPGQLRLVEALVVEAADVAHQGGAECRLRRRRLGADAAGEHHCQRGKRHERSQNACRKSLLTQESPPPPTVEWPTRGRLMLNPPWPSCELRRAPGSGVRAPSGGTFRPWRQARFSRSTPPIPAFSRIRTRS